MMKRLRFKFIAAAMLSVFVVLLVLLGTVNLLNYQKVTQDADHTLGILAENEGRFPDSDIHKEENLPKQKQQMPKPHEENREMSPELPYESRYFSVTLKEDGTALHTDTGRIAAVNSKKAQTYAKKAADSSKEKGFLSYYRYKKTEIEDGKTMIIFLDCSRSLATFGSFLVTSIWVSCLGLTAVFLLTVLFSRKVVRPFAENYEKQKRFITDAGHEIKTPLTIIDADLSILEMEYGENEWSEDIQKQTLRLKNLTNDLIYLSKMEEDSPAIHKSDFSISEVAQEMTQSFQGPAKIQNKTLECRIEPMLSFCGDTGSIQRLFSILLDNALKYSPENGRIFFQMEKKGKNIVICVTNPAENLDSEKLPFLFDRFYRMDQSRNSGTGGHGIGLSIAKAIVLAHRGKIAASSQDGKSLTVTVTFPQ